MSAVLESLLESESQSAESARAQYRSVVTALANGADPRLEEVQAVLKATGTTAQQLAADVGALQSIGGSIDQLIQAEIASQERQAVVETIQMAEAEMNALIDEHRRKLLPLQMRIQELEHAQILGNTAKSTFVQNYAQNHHHLSESTNRRNNQIISAVEALAARLGKLDFEIQQAGGRAENRFQDEKAEAINELNELKLQIFDHQRNLKR